MEDQNLQAHFKFDDADLQANRSGQLTEKQRARLREDAKFASWGALILGMLLALVAAGVVIASLTMIFQSGNWHTGSVFILVALGLSGVALWSMGAASAPWEIKLQSAEGPVDIVKEESSAALDTTITHYKLRIGGKTFEVDPNVAEIMAPGDSFTVYYAEFAGGRQRDILSVQWVSTAE